MYRVLIVDDEKLMREALRAMVMQVEGFQVVACVESGEEAVEICAEVDVHIVLMDIMMPGISGIDASKAIYKRNPSITIYIITAYNNFSFAREALSAKVRDYISKPVSFSMISQILEEYKRAHSEKADYVRQLSQLLEEKQYLQITPVVTQVVEQVYEQEKETEADIRSRFLQIGGKVLGALDPIIKEEINLEEQFPINHLFARERISWTFWLYDVMDYAFRCMITAKYEHMRTVFDLIDNKLKENISLVTIGAACNISQSYLSKLFRQNLGISVMDYIHLRKLKCAKMYLAFTSMSMTDAAFKMGYNEGSYFSKVFKKYEGITPQQYKNQVST